MLTATNIDAHAVNTVAWLSAADATIVVPVYQRQYRWDIGGCEQLLADIRAVADSDERHMHFIGSILSAEMRTDRLSELVLIDGQQRITTLMLLVAALHHTVRDHDPLLAGELEQVLVHPDARATKLRPHRAWANVFEAVVTDSRGDAVRDSRFDDNYAFFRSQVRPDEVARVWRGLQKLEHVAITLGPGANAQQIFESLNSTGEPLRDHELIHNYVLMGLSHGEQTAIEDEFWLPIERHTGERIADFWNHYLVMIGGREVAVTRGRGVYEAFRTYFPRLEPAALRTHAEAWRAYAEVYGVLLDPAREADPDVSRHLRWLSVFGAGMFPLMMRVHREWTTGVIDKPTLVTVLEQLQSLQLRRTIVRLTNERLVARLLRALDDGVDALTLAISRLTPSDDRVRVALKFTELPHATYVMARLAGVDDVADVDVDHIFPLAPSDDWTGDGRTAWSDFDDDTQNAHRALAATLGNIVLLEEDAAMASFGASFPAKRAVLGRSAIPLTAEAARAEQWNTAAISARSASLAAAFMTTWPRRGPIVIDDDGLTPILDAVPRRGWPRGWQKEFAYVEYVGEHWEVPDVKYLFNRIFKRLWADSRISVETFSARRGGPVYPEMSWTGQWDRLDDEHFLYMGWDSRYMLTAIQGVLVEAGLAPEVFVKYSYLWAD